MITYRHTLIGSLALTLLLTVGSGSSSAQKFRSLGGNRSSNNGGGMNNGGMRLQMNGSSNLNKGILNKGNLNSGSKFNISGGQNSNKGFPGKFQTQHKGLGGLNPLKGQSMRNDLKHGSHGDQKFGGLQHILKGNHNDANHKLQHLGQGNHDGHGHKLQHLGQGNHDGHGHGKLLHLIQHNQKHGKICLGHNDWCHAKPKHCHWWYTWCKPLAYCEPEHHHHCQWNYVTCDYLVNGHVVHEDARWFLGLKGMLLPGQGVGIEEVAPGSPAAAVGLQPGMVITRCNGIDMLDEAALAQAIGTSGGALQMDLLLAEGTPATCVVVMQRVTSVSF